MQRANDAARRRWLVTYPFPLVLSDNQGWIRGPALAAPVTVTNDSADAKTIQAIQSEFRHSAVIDNPLQWEYRQANGVERLEEFLANIRVAGIDITDMRWYLPQADDREILSWYNMPYDGHWSDKGAEIYGRAVAQLLAARLIQSATTQRQTAAAHGLRASLHDDRP